MKKLNLLLSLMLVLALSLMLTNCDTETETITEIDTLYVPVVDSFYVDIAVADGGENTVAIGNDMTLVATIRTDEALTGVKKFWHVDGGALSTGEGDTVVWTAPETEGTFVVTVHASNGEKSTVSTMNVGSGAYVATADTFYVGGAACSGCHNGTYTNWETTAHAEAWETLMNSGHPASYCYPCHTVDFAQEAGNSGYDDVPTAMFENVQCESCHGPASAHRSSMSADDINISLYADNCTTCHSGTHHPFNTDWEVSGHNFDEFAEAISSCSGCHTGTGFVAKMDPESGVVFDAAAPVNVACAVCHDPHGNGNYAQLRGLGVPIASIEANGVADVIEMAGAGQLCAQCHHARRSADTQVVPGYGHFGPHGSPQSDMVAGVSAYDLDGAATFTGYKGGHYLIENSCTSCHMQAQPYPNASTGHTFAPTTSACAKCHGEIDSFEDIMAAEDFDGDGTIEGLQVEVEGLMHELEVELLAAGLDTTGSLGDWETALSNTIDDTLANGDPDPAAINIRKGGYNLSFVISDKSLGVHNPTYTVQMLQQSILFLNPSGLGSAKVLLSDEKVTVF